MSGSGKSSLVTQILHPALAQRIWGSREPAGKHDRIEGIELIDKVIEIDQSPIGRTPRSNPATYTGLWGPLRELLAAVPESRLRGYKPGRFSFNVKGGRCEACEGAGIVQIEMHFLPDVYVACEVCKGKRYNRETLEIHYKGKNVAEILEMTVEEALRFFEAVPSIRTKLQTLSDVGMGYIHLGQPATTLSGGEAQRVKLATELSKRATGKTFYILDEPTTGLHFDDVARLLERPLAPRRCAGTRSSSSSTTSTSSRRPTGSSTSGPRAATRAANWSPPARPSRWRARPKSYTGAYLRPALGKADAVAAGGRRRASGAANRWPPRRSPSPTRNGEGFAGSKARTSRRVARVTATYASLRSSSIARSGSSASTSVLRFGIRSASNPTSTTVSHSRPFDAWTVASSTRASGSRSAAIRARAAAKASTNASTVRNAAVQPRSASRAA